MRDLVAAHEMSFRAVKMLCNGDHNAAVALREPYCVRQCSFFICKVHAVALRRIACKTAIFLSISGLYAAATAASHDHHLLLSTFRHTDFSTTLNRFPPKGMCSGSHDLFKFLENNR